MDNAARALVFAGGILIGVLIISVCMYAYTMFKTTYEFNMEQHDELEKSQFNSFFINFPTTIKGWEAYNIINKVKDVNEDGFSLTTITLDGYLNETSAITEFYFTENFENNYTYSYRDSDYDGVYDTVTINK